MKRWLCILLSAIVGAVALLFAPVVTTAAVVPSYQTFQAASFYDDSLVHVVSGDALIDSRAPARPIASFGQAVGFLAAKTGGQPLFLAVTDAELQSIQNLNRFSTVPGSSTPIPGVQGKWFYSNLEDAQRWAGQAAARDGGPVHIIRTSVPESVSPAWSQPWVDEIQNPALFHRLENLNGPITVIPPPIP